jgi:hypothetical protein
MTQRFPRAATSAAMFALLAALTACSRSASERAGSKGRPARQAVASGTSASTRPRPTRVDAAPMARSTTTSSASAVAPPASRPTTAVAAATPAVQAPAQPEDVEATPQRRSDASEVAGSTAEVERSEPASATSLDAPHATAPVLPDGSGGAASGAAPSASNSNAPAASAAPVSATEDAAHDLHVGAAIDAAPRVEAAEPIAESAEAAVEPSGQTTAPVAAPESAALPFELSVGATTTYQTLFGAAHGHDALVGYLDLVAEAEIAPGTVATLELESVGGDGPDADVASFAATVLGWNANGGSAQDPDGFDRLYLAEAFVSTDVLGHDWVLDFGKLASTSYLDTNRVANDSTTQFLSGAFCNCVAAQIPFRGAGVALTYLGSDRFDLRLVAMRPDNSGAEASSRVFGGAQLDVFWCAEDERTGSCGVYVWSNGAEGDQSGCGVSLDQDCCEDVTAFARLGCQSEDDASPQDLSSAWSLGFEWRGPLQGRADDVLGLAFGVDTSHDSALDRESVYECYYKRFFSERFQATVHAQGMSHPGGDPAEDQVTSLGVRLQFNF